MMPPMHWLGCRCTKLLGFPLFRSVLVLHISLELLDYIRSCCRNNLCSVGVPADHSPVPHNVRVCTPWHRLFSVLLSRGDCSRLRGKLVGTVALCVRHADATLR